MFILNITNLAKGKTLFFHVLFHVMFINKHNINLAVLICPKTYVCKHESKQERQHIEQKNCSNDRLSYQVTL